MLKKKFNWEENLDKFDYEQLDQIKKGLDEKVNVWMFARLEYDANQMMVLRMGLKEGVDVSIFADPKISWQKMWRIFYNLKLSHDIYMNKNGGMSKKLKR